MFGATPLWSPRWLDVRVRYGDATDESASASRDAVAGRAVGGITLTGHDVIMC